MTLNKDGTGVFFGPKTDRKAEIESEILVIRSEIGRIEKMRAQTRDDSRFIHRLTELRSELRVLENTKEMLSSQ